MEFIDGLGIEPVLLLGIAFLAAFQCLLFRILSARQRRAAEQLFQRMEARIRALGDKERAELEARLERFREEQHRSFESFRIRLAEGELRKQIGSTRADCASVGRLDKRHQVMSLAQMGFDSRDISRKLRLSRGETELLLGLCDRFMTAETPDATPAL